MSDEDRLRYIVQRLSEKLGIREIDIYTKIREFAAERGITELSAAYLFARENNITLPPRFIKDVEPGQIVSIAGRIVDIGPVREVKGGRKVRDITIVDRSGSARITFWEELTTVPDELEVGKIYIFRALKARTDRIRGISFTFTRTSSILLCDECPEEEFPKVPSVITNLSNIPEGIPVTVEAIVDTKYDFIRKEKEDRTVKLQKLLITDGVNNRMLLCWGEHADECAKAEEGYKIRVSRVIGTKRTLPSGGTTIELKTTNSSTVEILGPAQLKLSKVKVKDLKPGMLDASVTIRVARIDRDTSFTSPDGRERYLFSFIGGDETGWVRVLAWDEIGRELAGRVRENTVMQINWPRVSQGEDIMELHIKRRTEYLLNPKGVIVELPSTPIPEVQVRLPSLTPMTIREMRFNLSEGEKIKGLILALVVHVFHGYYYLACPHCKRKVTKTDEGEYYCGYCNMQIDTPIPRTRISMVLDDGTGNIIASLMGNSADKWLGFNPAEYSDTDTFETDVEREITNRLLYHVVVSGTALDQMGGTVLFIREPTEDDLKLFAEKENI